MTSAAIVIPFRDRGRDPLRSSNLTRVVQHWRHFGTPVHVIGDGRDGAASFNRSAAYNTARRYCADVDVIVYAESDMLIDHQQVYEAIEKAAAAPGLVVPFSQYRYLSPADSDRVRRDLAAPVDCTPESVLNNGRSVGAVNVVSKLTMQMVGQWDERFEGSWYDDRAMNRAFTIAAGATRFVTGPGHHLYHLPGWKGDHLTDADRAATAKNRDRWRLYRLANSPDRIRELTAGGS